MTATPWYLSLFREEYFDIYGLILSEERTTRDVEGIVKLLDLRPGSRILDLACGHAIPLAERGYQVTGQDLSDVFLDRARAAADARGVTVDWVHRDMREIPFADEFDAVINIFTAFGYFESDAEDEHVLHQVHTKRCGPVDGCFSSCCIAMRLFETSNRLAYSDVTTASW